MYYFSCLKVCFTFNICFSVAKFMTTVKKNRNAFWCKSAIYFQSTG
uniref:Uncharacterized protein n=1 Tax=Heterorhabditis bacteriophora TaxID=37862 RepID=A0A1I7WF88_HETBA